MTPPRIGWYGDDFTGASDTLAVLAQAGERAMLFLGVPSQAMLARAAGALGGKLDAVGIAGATRAMAPAEMQAQLEPAGAFFARLGCPVVHYKVCSTFDSAPHVGSIAVAVRALRAHVRNVFVPIVGGQPSLGRYCVFGHLFAAAGRGGEVVRIDRHPTMRNHPSTPMHDSDLRAHLALQGLEPVTAIHGTAYSSDAQALDAHLDAALAKRPAAVLFDAARASDLAAIGRVIWEQAQHEPLVAVGASSVAQALVAHWKQGEAPPVTAPGLGAAPSPVFVFAGSLSPVTAAQVTAATRYEHIALSAADVLDHEKAAHAAGRIVAGLRAGRHVLAATAPQGQEAAHASTREMADATARFVRDVVHAHAMHGAPLRRIGIAGGDTSSLAVQALAPWGLSYRGALGAGVAVVRMHAEDPVVDGAELMLKGGQMGGPAVFEELLGPA